LQLRNDNSLTTGRDRHHEIYAVIRASLTCQDVVLALHRQALLAAGRYCMTNSNRAAWLEGAPAVCPPPSQVADPWRLVLLGAPGVGKGTQADLLRQRLGACHLSTGDVFRAARQSASQPSAAIAEAFALMRRGALVPDATVCEMVRERRRCLSCSGGFILDGFPRTLAQAESLKQLMESDQLSLDAVINYELPLNEIVERLSGRRTCEECKAVYHITGQPSQTAGICDHCGGRLYQREDDRPDAVTVRMDTYQRSTQPLIEFYENLGLLRRVAATGSPQEICERTISALEASRPSPPKPIG
jgi:adenylate kinase